MDAYYEKVQYFQEQNILNFISKAQQVSFFSLAFYFPLFYITYIIFLNFCLNF